MHVSSDNYEYRLDKVNISWPGIKNWDHKERKGVCEARRDEWRLSVARGGGVVGWAQGTALSLLGSLLPRSTAQACNGIPQCREWGCLAPPTTCDVATQGSDVAVTFRRWVGRGRWGDVTRIRLSRWHPIILSFRSGGGGLHNYHLIDKTAGHDFITPFSLHFCSGQHQPPMKHREFGPHHTFRSQFFSVTGKSPHYLGVSNPSEVRQ